MSFKWDKEIFLSHDPSGAVYSYQLKWGSCQYKSNLEGFRQQSQILHRHFQLEMKSQPPADICITGSPQNYPFVTSFYNFVIYPSKKFKIILIFLLCDSLWKTRLVLEVTPVAFSLNSIKIAELYKIWTFLSNNYLAKSNYLICTRLVCWLGLTSY